LDNALHADQEAVNLTPAEHPDRPGRLQGLAVGFDERYKRLHHVKDLEMAMQTNHEAVALTPSGHPSLVSLLHALAWSVIRRYRRLGDLNDLEISIGIFREAVDLTPLGHPDRPTQLQSHANSLRDRYQQLGDLKDLEVALKMAREALTLTPPGHPLRADRLHNLANSLQHRYARFGDGKDLVDIHTYYIESFQVPSSDPEASWDHASRWAAFAEQFQPSDCILAFRAAFNLLPEILWLGNSLPVRQYAIHRLDIHGATSSAPRICTELSDLHAAVEILEQGLATTFQQMLQLKTEVDVLPAHQARKLADLSLLLYNGTFDNPIDAAEDRKRLLADIRKQPGFECFLLPKPYNVLCGTSQGGPVLILTSHHHHCDAIIILNPTAEPVHVPLPGVTLELLRSQRDMLKDLLGRCNVRNRGQSSSSRLFGQREGFSRRPSEECFEDMLNWLWIHVVHTVYQALKIVSEKRVALLT
jgi:tetratricopeptide (TPR) repeat protein